MTTINVTTKVGFSYIFTADESGQWSGVVDGMDIGNMYESEVIAECKKSVDWPSIKSKHFAMDGFHN